MTVIYHKLPNFRIEKTSPLKKLQLAGLSILSGLLLSAAWPVSQFTLLVFVGFVPLLYIASTVTKRNRFFLYSFIAMLVWNALTTWWMWNSTDVGSVAAIVANSLLMCLPWWGFHLFKNKFGKRIGYGSLIACWMLFEYIHLNWQLSWPWLSIGNVFAAKTNWVQWYEYTGIGGGTLWVLAVNILLFEWSREFRQEVLGEQVKKVTIIVSLLFFPIIFSFLLSIHPSRLAVDYKVAVVQPNIDPYQKFEGSSTSQQIAKLISLSEQAVDSTTKLLLWPETAMSANVAINEIEKANVYKPVFDFVNRYPNITLLSGIETYQFLGTEKTTATARKTQDGQYYDAYNAAISIHAKEPMQFYVKSKLVPGVETLPSFLNILAPLFEKFGGSTGGYAKDTAAKAFENSGNPFVTAPVICYESIYGEYVASYIKKGANLITIITNDGWWGNTPGHKQHLQYAKLRAIETRKWVVRSANTGISAVIDEYGDVLATQGWDQAAFIKYGVPAKTDQTFYVKHGDYLYKIFSLLALLLIGWNLVLWLKNKFVPVAKP